ncbi:NF038122 family metalloprotease [Bradyrhizobium sp. AZCC 2230]|uniref:NF038122 family metalloprotease n=1 Tax=Bradyrhizobium sp. AZCC 2230 TaxID=3117021 RepID=UPI002FF26462
MADAESDDLIYTVVGNEIQGSYTPAGSGATISNASTAGAVISATSAGIRINLILDAAAQAAPASFKNGLQQAAAILAASITDQITVNINIDYSGMGGGAAAGPDHGYLENYSSVRSALVNNASVGDTTFNSLPNASSIQGQSQVAVWNAQLKLWGVLGANDTTTDDASAYFSTDINPNLLVGVALHELTHAWGRVPYGPPYGSQPDIFDLFRFTSPGTRLISGTSTAPAAYFSLDGGNTKLADYGLNSDPSDFLNSGVQGPNDPFNEYYSSTTIQGLTALDLKQLDALGFHLAVNNPTIIESSGSTSLVQIGSSYFLDPTAGGTGPELKYQGAAVTVGEFGAYTPIGVEAISTGYEVAWKMAGADLYSVWSTDSSGNYTGNLYTPGSGSSAALEALEPSFRQDLNGDGVIGVPTLVSTVTEALGSTSLVQVGQNFYLDDISTNTGPTLKYGGVAVVAGQFGGYTPIGAEHTSTGYEVAWKIAGADTYSVWSTDSNGNYTGNYYQPGTGSSAALEALEPSFHQDLNGDGVIGVPVPAGTVIEALGSTSLVQAGQNFYLKDISAGTGPTLKYGGVAVVAGQFGGYTPIGAEQTSTGYEVAWKVAGVDTYSVWSTDSNGNYTGNSYQPGPGSSAALETLETSFHQDLNGDGVIGVATIVGTVIEALGSTSLVQVGQNFYLKDISTGTGPTLKYGGAAVAAGQFGGYTPLGVEQTSTGYEVAWKMAGADLYSVWSTDSSGNYTGNLYMPGSGSSAAFEALEASFHQDLNGDTVIGAHANIPDPHAAAVSGPVLLASHWHIV